MNATYDAVQRTITSLLPLVSPSSFQRSCLIQFQGLSPLQLQNDIQFISSNGSHTSVFDKTTAGVSYGSCVRYCGNGAFAFPFSYANFANAMTNYLLPWLALTAQLPYEGGDPWSNTLSFFLAVGSPALAAYSLAISIQNRAWASKRFDSLARMAMNLPRDHAPWLVDRIRAVQVLLQEGQQVPLRGSQTDGHLASLIVLPQNHVWWDHVRARLTDTRRVITPSLVAQMSLAVAAWILTVLAAFATALGDPNASDQISSSTLWTWLIPVVLGWVMVGTQSKSRSIENALNADAWIAVNPSELRSMPAILEEIEPEPLARTSTSESWGKEQQQARKNSLAQARIAESKFVRLTRQKGLYCKSSADEIGVYDHELGTWQGLSVGGNEEVKGPAFNYARVFTWCELAETMRTALEREVEAVRHGIVCRPSDGSGQQVDVKWHTHGHENNFRADSLAITRYCGMSVRSSSGIQEPDSIQAHKSRRELNSAVKRRLFIASLVAIMVQWGTAGDSIMQAYLTPPVGLGCRTGSYLTYATFSTLAWILLMLASILSHDANVAHQAHLQGDWRNGRQRSTMLSIKCASAVILRVTGQTICILNGVWIIITSLFEMIGVYDTCWCQTDWPVVHDKGWYHLFQTSKDLASQAASSWGGGLATTVVVITLVLLFFGLVTSRDDD